MTRDPSALRGQVFDVVIVGGGAFAACAAWEAALRNYSVALIEANDFGSGTSANSFKFVHGGIRYLQHLDLPRLRSSCHERSALLRIAPQLVKPMPVAIPTYGHGRNGRAFLGAGFLAYDALTLDRNRGIRDRTRHIPATSFMHRQEVLERFPGVDAGNLTGAAVFSDAQMFHPPRLVLSFILSAMEKGAVAVNYVEAKSLLRRGDRITGVMARDRLSGEQFELRGRVVLNAAGPWSEELLKSRDGMTLPEAGVYSRDTCFVVDGAAETDYALAVQGLSFDRGAIVGRAARHLFVVPWRGRRLIGVWHIVYRKGPGSVDVTEQELDKMLREVNAAHRGLDLRREHIRLVNAGLVPFGDSDESGDQLDFGKRSHLVDSESRHGVAGLVSIIGVRHTMARGDAARALDIVDRKLKRAGKAPDSAYEPLAGGDIGSVDALVHDVRSRLAGSDSQDLAPELAALYGSRVFEVLAWGGDEVRRIAGGDITRAQVDAAVRREMAVTLGDLVLRRTPLAAGGNPGREVLAACADVMGDRLGWSRDRKARETDTVLQRFPTVTHAGRISEPRSGLWRDTAERVDVA